MAPKIRKAKMSDREALHAAHMRSIREICIQDHGPEEIKGWGYRELGDRWIAGITNGLVWLVECQGTVHGLASISFNDSNEQAHIQALYLTPEIVGLGMGRRLMEIMLECARERNVKTVALDSTITAHGFYEKFGFRDSGPTTKEPIGGIPVTSTPMLLNLF